MDLLVSQMLGSWQIGDVETMRKYYADDVAVVSAAWEPPLFGWEKYARGYQAQFARTNGGRLDRSNSYAKVLGDNAWVTYQWRFVGQVDGTPTTAFGHTNAGSRKARGQVGDRARTTPQRCPYPCKQPHPRRLLRNRHTLGHHPARGNRLPGRAGCHAPTTKKSRSATLGGRESDPHPDDSAHH